MLKIIVLTLLLLLTVQINVPVQLVQEPAYKSNTSVNTNQNSYLKVTWTCGTYFKDVFTVLNFKRCELT